MNQSVKRLVSSVVSLAFILISFVIFFILIQPLAGEVLAKRGELAGLEEARKEQDVLKKTMRDLIAKIEDPNKETSRELLSLALPDSSETGEALFQMNEIALSSNLGPQSYNLSLAKDKQLQDRNAKKDSTILRSYSKVAMKMLITGSYENLGDLLNMIETNIRIFDVQNISIQRPDPKKSDFNIELQVATYYQQAK